MKLLRRHRNILPHLCLFALVVVSISGCAQRDNATRARESSAASTTSAEPGSTEARSENAPAEADDTVLLFVASDEDSFHGVWTWVTIDAESFPKLKLESTTHQKIPELMEQFNLTSVPAYIILKNGKPVEGFHSTDRKQIWENVEKYTPRKS
jgi:hypothetical protein